MHFFMNRKNKIKKQTIHLGQNGDYRVIKKLKSEILCQSMFLFALSGNNTMGNILFWKQAGHPVDNKQACYSDQIRIPTGRKPLVQPHTWIQI